MSHLRPPSYGRSVLLWTVAALLVHLPGLSRNVPYSTSTSWSTSKRLVSCPYPTTASAAHKQRSMSACKQSCPQVRSLVLLYRYRMYTRPYLHRLPWSAQVRVPLVCGCYCSGGGCGRMAAAACSSAMSTRSRLSTCSFRWTSNACMTGCLCLFATQQEKTWRTD
jgi:hypothetical protein